MITQRSNSVHCGGGENLTVHADKIWISFLFCFICMFSPNVPFSKLYMGCQWQLWYTLFYIIRYCTVLFQFYLVSCMQLILKIVGIHWISVVCPADTTHLWCKDQLLKDPNNNKQANPRVLRWWQQANWKFGDNKYPNTYWLLPPWGFFRSTILQGRYQLY